MNIFYLHNDPKICARYHCDKHVVKMVLETAQILSTAHRVIDNSDDSRLYRKTHVNHPCCKWARESDKNYVWLFELYDNLLCEYFFRYRKTHACRRLRDILSTPPKGIPITSGTTERPICVDKDSLTDSAIESYRAYYRNSKRHIANWKDRNVPEWYY